MTSFLDRLFRYRASADRRPLEDFLSEVLVDFLNRSPIEDANVLIENCFIPLPLVNQYRSIVAGRRAHARTQIRIVGNKCLDVLLELDNQPLLIIENKLWASFQYHMRIDVETEEQEEEYEEKNSIREQKEVTYDHQLVTYGQWLANAAKPEQWPGVLCVLTHASQPPADFIFSNTDRYGAIPHLQLWRNMHGEIARISGSNGSDPNPLAWQFVGRELCEFLEINNMSSSDLSAVDISSINVSMSPLRKISNVFAEVGAELLQRFPEKFVRRGQSNIVELKDSRVWGWTYFQGPGKMYLAYGIYFSPIVGQFSGAIPPLSDQEQAFLVVGSDEHAIKFGDSGLSDGWSRLGDETWLIIKPFPLSTRQIGERFPQFIVRLIQENFADINAILEKDLQIHSEEASVLSSDTP